MELAGQLEAFVEQFQVFDAEALGNGQGYGDLFRGTVHGVDVGEVDNGGLVSQMFHWGIDQIEVDSFHQEVGSHQGLLAGEVQHGGIIAYAISGFGIL